MTTLVTAATAAMILYATALSSPALDPFRYFTIVPVALAAYRRRGLLPGQVMAGFFSSIFLWQLAWGWYDSGFSESTVELVFAIIFLHLSAYVVTGVGSSVRSRETLTDAARGWEGLLTRVSRLNDAADFIQIQAKVITDAREASLLVRNPVEEGWEIVATSGWVRLPSHPDADGNVNLAQWLAAQGRPQMIADLDADPRFESSRLDPAAGPRSLLAEPLVTSDGTILAILVLLDRRSRPFGRHDLDRIRDLLAAGGKALEQAGLLARTDLALARRAAQLAAIQRTARDLNATLDPDKIVGRTLACAMEIAGADAGLVSVSALGIQITWRSQGVILDADRAMAMAKAAGMYRSPLLDPPPDLSFPPLSEDSQSRMVIPLLRESEELGIVVVESLIADAFDGQDLLAMAALGDHAVTALETARQFDQIRRERSRADLIISTMADGLLSLGPDGQVMVMNAAAETLTGWSANRGVGRLICEVLECRGSNNCGDNCRLRTALRDGQALHENHWITHMPEGTARVLALNATPLPANDASGGNTGTVLVLRDVTDRDELERFQRDLVASVSHEMRAPLANIYAVADLLLETGGRGEFTLREGLGTIQAQTRRLADFTERALDVSRLETGAWHLEPRPLPVALLVKAAVREWQTAHPTRAIAFELPSEPLWAWADEQSVSLVLGNLISNAIKYSPENVAITVSTAQGPEGFLTLAVTDYGPGIPPEQQIHVFERFYRAEASDSQRTYGYGLGLYISRHLVEAMGGRIGVTSEPGLGSRFAFTLPEYDATDGDA